MNGRMRSETRNVDTKVVDGFGAEWSKFTNAELSVDELAEIFSHYVSVFPWEDLPAGAVGFDAGCGSGRWAKFFAPVGGRTPLHRCEQICS